MNVYADHNFLINCLNREGWESYVKKACDSGHLELVLSPWSIYEIGNSSPAHMEELLAITEDFHPSWILERVDLQLREFVVAWNDFWNGRRTQFDPIRTLAEVHASFFRCGLEALEGFSLRDYASEWQRPEASTEADAEFRRQALISSVNRIGYLDGKVTSGAIREIRKRYVARQFAIARTVGLPHEEIHQRENWILGHPRLEVFISFFVDWGGTDELLAHRVEEALTFNQWKSDARLNPNRVVDRFHAVAALPYCELFVTSDSELIKKARTVKNDLNFAIAEVISGDELIERLIKDEPLCSGLQTLR